MTRIVAGTLRGRRLKTPAGALTRPTSEKVREAIFSKLTHWGVIEDARVLDLFAGTGALGIEAISRGARSVTFVEKSSRVLEVIKNNAGMIAPNSRVVRGDAQKYVAAAKDKYDLILIDPPYDLPTPNVNQMLIDLVENLTQWGIIVLERRSDSEPLQIPVEMTVEDERTWGDTTVSFLGFPQEGIAS